MALPDPLRRPALAPGVRVVRRDDRHLQVGEHAGQRLVLPDEPAVRALLADLAAARPPSGPSRWYDALRERALVVDDDELAADLTLGLPRAGVLAAHRRGDGASARLTARSRARVALDAAPPWRAPLLRLLAAAGLRTSGAGQPAALRLVAGAAGADALDAPMRSGLPHLVVGAESGRVVVGPFVAPGLTACLRCVLAHRCERDPGHATVRAQSGTGAESVDPELVHLALAWAVRDTVAFVEGDLPRTWSATVEVDPALEQRRQSWSRHPACGCAWGEELAAG